MGGKANAGTERSHQRRHLGNDRRVTCCDCGDDVMTKAELDRIRRAAAFIAVANRPPQFGSLAEMRAATQWVEMRRAAQEFASAPQGPSAKPYGVGLPICNGAGHVGAI